jgi:preprotein translocase subunit SecG
MYGILLSVLVIFSVFLVVFILMQSDKGGGLAGTFGGMGGGGMPFSGREAATILSKLTTGLAIAFMAICILLSIISRNRAHTVADSALQKRAQKIQKVESQAASSVLDQNRPSLGGLQEGQSALPEEAQTSPAPVQAKPAQPSESGKKTAPAPETPKPLFGN